MRILQIFNRYLHRGGEEMSVERISDSLSERHEVFHCYFDSRQIGTLKDPFEVMEGALSMLWNQKSAARLRSHARAVCPDVILLHNFFPIGTASLLSEIGSLGIPTLFYVHNFRPFSVNGYLWAGEKIAPAGLRQNFFPEIYHGAWQNSRAKTALYAAILIVMHQLRLFRHISQWIAISNFMQEKFIEAGVPKDRIVTIPHSWDPLPECPAHRDNGFYLFLGRLITAKGVTVLFSAWRILREQLGERCPKLVICGEGPLSQEISRMALDSPAIEFCGQVDGKKKFDLIQGCRAMIAPSLWWEPLGLVTYEAYDFGKPMLAARSGGLTETVVHGSTGFLHSPGNAEELADQIRCIDANVDFRIQLGKNGRRWLLERTAKNIWIEKFEILLRKTVNEGKRRFPQPK
jgi:glycosyltransferase involved in cell wall biosynthesis